MILRSGLECQSHCQSRVIGYRETAAGWEMLSVCKECGAESKPSPSKPPEWFSPEKELTCSDCGLSFTDLNPWSGHVLLLHRRNVHEVEGC